MGRLKRPRKAWGRPNLLDPLILLWLDHRGGRGEVQRFPHRLPFQRKNEPITEIRFSRSAIYFGFNRLKRKGLLRMVEASPLTFELADRTGVYQVVFDLWQKVYPPQPTAPRRTNDPRQLRLLLKRIGAGYLRLRTRYKSVFEKAIEEDHVMGEPFEGAVSTRDLLTSDEARELQDKVENLLKQDRFIQEEERAKAVPLASRPANWSRPGWKPPPLVKDVGMEEQAEKGRNDKTRLRELPLAEQMMEDIECPECHIKTVYDKEQGKSFCPKCGLECHAP